MARIRSIKPEFWVSEQVVECSPIARLLFIGMWSFCDDAGIHPASARTLKMEVFPGDDFTAEAVQALIDELIGAGLIHSYVVDGKGYWQVTGWHHQKIEKPTSKYPKPPKSTGNLPAIDEESSNSRRIVVESSTTERKGEEGRGEEVKQPNGCSSAEPPANGPEADSENPVNPMPNVPHGEIVKAYNEILATQGLTGVKLNLWANSERAAALRTRWREDPGRQNLEWWQGFFRYVAESDFLMGRAKSDRTWQADLGWLLKRENFAKVCEGKYHA